MNGSAAALSVQRTGRCNSLDLSSVDGTAPRYPVTPSCAVRYTPTGRRGTQGWRVRIEGHCDDRGSERYNLALGERRANAVRQIFLDQGIADSRMDVVSFGEERPAADGTSDDARAQNRRAVIIHLSR